MSEKKEEKDYTKESKFIVEHAKHLGDKDGKTTYQVTQEPFLRYMKDQGLSKATLDQVAEANHNFLNGTIQAATELAKSHPDSEQVVIRVRTPNGRIDTTMKKTVENKNPATGETVIRHGVFSVRANMKSQMDKGLLKSCEAAITKMVK